MLAHKVKPDMQRRPVVNRGGESWARTLEFRQTRLLWARAADSYLLWPINERHSPHCSRIRFSTGVSLQTLQHQRELTAGGPCRSKIFPELCFPVSTDQVKPVMPRRLPPHWHRFRETPCRYQQRASGPCQWLLSPPAAWRGCLFPGV